MKFEANIFEKKLPIKEKLLAYGFQEKDEEFFYSFPLKNNNFKATINVDKNGITTCEVIDTFTEEPYLLIDSEFAVGDYIASLREEYGAKLEDIVRSCYQSVPFSSPQANRITKAIKEKYQVDPDFPFTTKNNRSYGVFRNSKNRLWFGLLMHVKEGILYPNSKAMEILNLKRFKDEENKPLPKGIYPGFHMNKKSWMTLPLDDSLSDEEILSFVKESYLLTIKKNESLDSAWILPANPKYFDIISAFSLNKDLFWHQPSSIQKGDIVNFYVGAPYSALLYQTKVIATDIHDPTYRRTIMKIQLLKTYPKEKYPHSLLSQYGIAYVRGARHITKEFAKKLKEDNENA